MVHPVEPQNDMTLSESGSLDRSVMWTELECGLDSITIFFLIKRKECYVGRRASLHILLM